MGRRTFGSFRANPNCQNGLQCSAENCYDGLFVLDLMPPWQQRRAASSVFFELGRQSRERQAESEEDKNT